MPTPDDAEYGQLLADELLGVDPGSDTPPSTRPNPPTVNAPNSLTAPSDLPPGGADTVRPSRFRGWKVPVAIGAVVVLVAGGVVLALTRQTTTAPPSTPTVAATDPSIASIVNGAPSALQFSGPSVDLLPPTKLSDAPQMTAGGLPVLFYVDSGYCGNCAIENFPVAIALANFGTFSGLTPTQSDQADGLPPYNTVRFYKSTYSSQYLVFQPVELYSNQPQGDSYQLLQPLTPSQQSVFTTYDAPPYASSTGSVPFLYFNGTYVQYGSQFAAHFFDNLSLSDIANQMQQQSDLRNNVMAAANVDIAEICQMTHGQPQQVCTASSVEAAASMLPS